MGGLMRRVVPLVAALGLMLGLVPVVAAASPATFGTPTAESTFGTGIVFSQPVTVTKPIGRVELLLTVADSIGPTIQEIGYPPIAGAMNLTYTLDTAGGAHLIPNTPIVARWRLFAADEPSVPILGPDIKVVYADDRFEWKTVSDDVVRVHWYKGDAAFGAKALKLGADEVRATSKLLGVTESDPVDFFVYADQAEFYGALGPGAHENVAGTAFANIRTLLGLIPPNEIDDPLVAVRIPHEFVHMVFDTASKNPYHAPPRWLNEGLAVYQSQSYDTSDRAAVQDAARTGTLIPLDGLTGQFPNGNDFFLAYAESVSAVAFMIDTYGQDALVTLIRSYADGRTDDEAFHDALGVDTAGFTAAWFKDLNAKEPTKYGPQPAPAGPVPSAWAAGVPGGAAGSPGPVAGGTNAAPVASGGLPADSAAPGAQAPTKASSSIGWLAPIGLIVVVVIVVAVLVARRRRRTTDEAS
jgi:hypothetical protein